MRHQNGASGGTRTPTSLRIADFESAASTIPPLRPTVWMTDPARGRPQPEAWGIHVDNAVRQRPARRGTRNAMRNGHRRRALLQVSNASWWERFYAVMQAETSKQTTAPTQHSAGVSWPLLVAALAAIVFAWLISDVILLAFAAVIVALGLDALARPLVRHLHIKRGLAITLACLLVIGIFAAVVLVFGQQIATQLGEITTRLPEAINRFVQANDVGGLTDVLKGSMLGDAFAKALAWVTTVAGVVTSLAFVFAASIYIALDPSTYRQGFLKLVPRAIEAETAAGLDDAGLALRRWFGGQLLAMALVGVMTAVGLWLLGIPGYLGLGLIAGLTEFIPILGPIAGAVPALLLASMQDWTTVAWVALLFVAIQLVENNLILPLVTGRAVLMPPAVGIFAVVAMGVAFGPLGLLLGYPLAIVIDVAIRRYYVRDTLDRRTELPSDRVDAAS